MGFVVSKRSSQVQDRKASTSTTTSWASARKGSRARLSSVTEGICAQIANSRSHKQEVEALCLPSLRNLDRSSRSLSLQRSDARPIDVRSRSKAGRFYLRSGRNEQK